MKKDVFIFNLYDFLTQDSMKIEKVNKQQFLEEYPEEETLTTFYDTFNEAKEDFMEILDSLKEDYPYEEQFKKEEEYIKNLKETDL